MFHYIVCAFSLKTMKISRKKIERKVTISQMVIRQMTAFQNRFSLPVVLLLSLFKMPAILTVHIASSVGDALPNKSRLLHVLKSVASVVLPSSTLKFIGLINK